MVIANNGDWKQIDAVMRKIQETQEKAIQLNRKAFNPKETKQNLKTLITALFERGAHTPEDKADRNKVSEILQTFKPDFFYFYDTKSSIDEDTYDLIKIIEKKGTAYISVDSSRFYRAVDHGNPLTWKLKQGASSDHAVALVGFSATKHKFYVKDCNTPHIIEMNPKDLFLSMQSGFVLVPKVKKPRAKL